MSEASRALDELINRDEPGMDLVRQWAGESERAVEILPSNVAEAERTLLALQISTRSPLGAIAYETGGIVVDNDWLRILGAGSPRLPRNIVDWNRLGEPQARHRLPGALLVGDDAVGGFFSVDGGGLGGQPGHVHYLAPDTCEWEELGIGYTDWLDWVFTGDLPGFYDSLRWPGWESEVAKLGGDRCISIYPFLWAKGGPIEERSRKAIPVEETWSLHAIELPNQLAGSDE